MPIVSSNEESDKANQISNWWQKVEQKSLELSLEFSYLYHTDIANCYGSIYTHSIPWALHTKEIAKSKKYRHCKNLVGNEIDKQIRDMSYGQTNGIPQGSVLMDFIAEIVLKYADLQLSEKLNKLDISSTDYKILRYRDDYRIFTNNTQVADTIIKTLTEVLEELGLKLNSNKTISSDNVIQGSIKKDKLNWLMIKQDKASLQKKLLLIHKFSLENINSGILDEELQNIFNTINISNIKCKKVQETKKIQFKEKENIIVLLSIIVDIAFLNPRTYPIASAIISQLIQFIKDDEREKFIKTMMKKFSTIPNTGHMQIWMQRAIKNYQKDFEEPICRLFEEPICRLVNGEKKPIWNDKWVNKNVKTIFDENNIIDDDVLDNLPSVIRWNEVLLFGKKHYY